jgi:hypothetical protein
MRNRFHAPLLLAVFLLCPALLAPAEPLRIFLAPTGNDAWSGLLPCANESGNDGPLQTLHAARDRVRALRAEGKGGQGVEIRLRAGIYRISTPLELQSEDSGSPDAPVIWRAHDAEVAVISGGVPITGWTLEEEIWSAPLPREIAVLGEASALWLDDRRATLARTPDAGTFFEAAGVPADLGGLNNLPENADHKIFKVKPEHLGAFKDADSAIVAVFHSWETSYHRIAAVDADRGLITFKNAAPWNFGHWDKNQRYYIANTADACDAAGEWFADFHEGRILYHPREGEIPARMRVEMPRAGQLLTVHGSPERPVRHLRFQGLIFANTHLPFGPEGHADAQAAFSVPAAIDFQYAENCELSDCRIRGTGGYALWFNAGCRNNVLARSVLEDLGAGGVRVGVSSPPADSMDESPELPAGNRVHNNIIRHGGRIFWAGVGVFITHARDTEITHNEIADFYYTGVSNGWVWGYGNNPTRGSKIEFNHIHDIGQGVLSDMGGIYNLGIQPGSTNRHNLIHDVDSFSYGGWGLYTDEGSTGILLENNIVYRVKDGGFHQHYGRDNIVRNNILLFSRQMQVRVSRVEEHRSIVFERNIVVSDNGFVFDKNWSKAKLDADYNLYWDAAGQPLKFADMDFATWQQQSGRDAHSMVADPLFEDLAGFDLRMKPQSPALALGFVPIDATLSGLTGDPAWVLRARMEKILLQEDFENSLLNALPHCERVYELGHGAAARITTEDAASGTQCLLLRRGKQEKGPVLLWRTGPLPREFLLRARLQLSPHAALRIEFPAADSAGGPGVEISTAAGLRLFCGDASSTPRESMTINADAWLQLDMALDSRSDFSCTLTLPSGETQSATLPLASAADQSLDRFEIQALGDPETIMFLDDLILLRD